MFSLHPSVNHYRVKLLNQFYGHVKVTIYIYAFLKYGFKDALNININIVKCLAILLSPIVFITTWLLRSAKMLVACWVAYTEPNYVDMLDGTETVFLATESDRSRAIITTVFLLEDTEDKQLSGDDFYNLCVQNISRIFSQEKFLKLRCSVQYKLGYFYLRKETWANETFFKSFYCNSGRKSLSLSMEQLRGFVSEVSNQEMPQNDAGMWEVRVSKEKLEGTNAYPMVIRFHHVFGDAITLFDMFTADFQTHHKSSYKSILQSEVRSLDATFTTDPFITMHGIFDTPDSNVMCQSNGDKHVVWCTEQSPYILKTIKEVKTNLSKVGNNVYSVDVILTCFLESLSAHFEKEKVNLPENVYLLLPMMPSDLKESSYGTFSNYKMKTKVSAAALRLPLNLGNNMKGSSLLRRLEKVKQVYHVFKNGSIDYWFNRWQGTVVLTFLPFFLQKWFFSNFGITLVVSNIPGCDSLKFFGRLKVKEFVCIDPNTLETGVTLMITSYENRLNFAYTIDKAVIPKAEDVKKIAIDFMHNLDKLKQITS